MSKYRLTVLTPIHISSGDEFELNYNLLQKDRFIYIYDEFKLAEYFIAQDIAIPPNLDELKKLIEKKSDDIIASGLYIRKIETDFSAFQKPMLENISTADKPIVTGSSIKGSLRTAILDCMYHGYKQCENMDRLIKNRNKDFKERLINDRNMTPYDNDLAEIFKYLKVSDSMLSLETKIYKTINIKKEKSHQSNRQNKVEEIANYVEAIKPGQSFEIEINDTHEKKIFKSISWICNKFYIPFFTNDQKYYFSKETDITEKVKNASSGVFIINVGRFGGAESKSLNDLRYINASKSLEKSTTSARTFALEFEKKDRVYYEAELIPFGWVMCEKIEYSDYGNIKEKKSKFQKLKSEKYQAIDILSQQKEKKKLVKREKEAAKQKMQEEREKKIKYEREKREAELAKMSPVERIIDSYSELASLINDMKSNKIENFAEIKVELATKVKAELQKNPKTWERAKQKALKRKEYIESLLNS